MNAILASRIAESIREHGPMAVDEYMSAALLDPHQGYYTSGNPLGRDFTTAPEVSQMFGELIGLWCADGWSRLGKPAPVLLVELGPGRGTLMRDALRAIEQVCSEFARSLEVHLVEISEPLRRMQEAAVGNAGVPVFWHESLDHVPEGPMLMIANEFFDVLPVRQFQFTSSGWRERCIGLAGDEATFVIHLGEIHSKEVCLSALTGEPAPGEIFEACPKGDDIARHLGARLNEASGAALLVDYGSISRPCGDSLSALCGHGSVDPLKALPGTADMSAWVDFGALAKAAHTGGNDRSRAGSGVAIFGPVPQGSFLRRLGIAERAARLQVPAADLTRLVDPGAMGAVFKVMALVSGLMDGASPAGFHDGECWCDAEDG